MLHTLYFGCFTHIIFRTLYTSKISDIFRILCTLFTSVIDIPRVLHHDFDKNLYDKNLYDENLFYINRFYGFIITGLTRIGMTRICFTIGLTRIGMTTSKTDIYIKIDIKYLPTILPFTYHNHFLLPSFFCYHLYLYKYIITY
jgi:hypothetical protein